MMKVRNLGRKSLDEVLAKANEITAEKAGTITSITVQKGDSVMEGTVLVTIA